MTRVYWDTMLFIYWLEGHAEFGPRMRAVRQRMQARGDRLCASPLTLAELLVGPERHGDQEAIEQLQLLFRGPSVEVLPVSTAAAGGFAKLRAASRIDAFDAMHLAVAAAGGVDLFLTNDMRLARLKVPGIDFIATLDAGVL